MKKIISTCSRIFILLAVIPFLIGCPSTQHLITGEPLVYSVDPLQGTVLDRDVVSSSQKVIPHKGEIIAVVVNSVFLKFLKELGSPHVLVYAEVYDDGSDDPEKALKKVLFNELNQPSGVNLGLSDRIIYGPAAYKGYPIRIKFYIVELDKEDKELASKIISSAGGLVSAAQPQAAAAVGVAVQVAQTINALNEDDFELRFDLTLYPVAPLGVSDINEKRLSTLSPPEPVQREGKTISLVNSLRTGPYVILKRELEERLEGNSEDGESTLLFDFAQEYFINSYKTPKGETVFSNEILRYQGGYLYRIVSEVLNKEGTKLPNGSVVRLKKGPNRKVDFALVPGIRQLFKDQTYAVLSVVNGLPLGADQATLRAASDRDLMQLTKILDNPAGTPSSTRLNEQVDNLASSVKTVLAQKRVAKIAARRVGRDSNFRTSPQYPLFWLQHIDDLSKSQAGSQERRNAVASNAGVLDTLSDLILNLPVFSPDNSQEMQNIKNLTTESFETDSENKGIFKLTDAALANL